MRLPRGSVARVNYLVGDHAGHRILRVGGALTGYMTLAATVTHAKVAEAIGQGQGGGALMHGPTLWKPTCRAVANASLTIIQSVTENASTAYRMPVTRGTWSIKASPDVADVRVLCAIGVVELNKPVTGAHASTFVEPVRGYVHLVVSRNMPPYLHQRTATQ